MRLKPDFARTSVAMAVFVALTTGANVVQAHPLPRLPPPIPVEVDSTR